MSVQISQELFRALVIYFETGEGDPDAIRVALEAKLDAMIRRDAYTRSKTAPTPEEREKARREYLDRAGIGEDFRW